MIWLEFYNNVIKWAKERKIIPNSTPVAQRGKTYEEFAEAYKAFIKNDMDEFKDGIGDTAVTLVIVDYLQFNDDRNRNRLEPTTPVFPLDDDAVHYMNRAASSIAENQNSAAIQFLYYAVRKTNVQWSECLEQAWNEIKDRTGTMGEDGVFYKSQ